MINELWHTLRAEDIAAYWQTNLVEGLDTCEIKKRLQNYGYNEIAEKPSLPLWKRFIAQFKDFMVLVLLAATLISAVLGEFADAATILIIVLINAILGFMQEYKAEQSLNALKRLASPTALVIRNSITQQIQARELVPGDILVLEAGDKLAADGRLLETASLELEEAALTGESMPLEKTAGKIYCENCLLADRKNMVYAGTSVTRGRGKAIVCATAMTTEIGHIACMLQSTEEQETPLEKRLEHLGKWLVWLCLIICLIVVATGIAKGEQVMLMCMSGISLAVAAIPEGLPAIVTVALAIGVQRMIKRQAIIRKLPAVETLGCTTVICSDKTGTLTQNAMTVHKVYSGGNLYEVSGTGYDIIGKFFLNKKEVKPSIEKSLYQCLLIGALCNNSLLKKKNISISGIWRRSSEDWSIEGDPTEGALITAAGKADIWREKIEKARKRLIEVPFASDRRRMSVVYDKDNNNKAVLYIKGAPDTVLDLCTYYFDGAVERPLNETLRQEIALVNERLGAEALRVLATAYRNFAPHELSKAADEKIEHELVFAGLVGMSDPPRPEVREAIKRCRQAGIKTVMITGDHPNTAVAIAKTLNVFDEVKDKSLTGQELDLLDEERFRKIVNKVSVYARVSPAHKLRIVKALKNYGHIVAMTGDGVNDAPAIKEADIGIAMGIGGTEVTKEASAMVLADDNFATIVAAVEEGRGIYDNIRKFIRYLLSCNIGEVLTMFIAALVGLPLPLLPVQILWVNLVTDGLPAMALGVDTNSEDIMRRPPRAPRESIFSGGLSKKIGLRGMQIGLSTIGIFTWVYLVRQDLQLARSMALTTLVFSQLFHVFDCRSEVKSAFEAGLLSNKYLNLAVACSITMQAAVIYHPVLQSIFNTVPLSISDWLVILSLAGCTFIFGGVKQMIIRRRYRARSVYNGV